MHPMVRAIEARVPINSTHLPDSQLTRVQRERTTVETSVSRFVGVDHHTTTDLLAFEEPLELQLACGPSGSRRLKGLLLQRVSNSGDISWHKNRVFISKVFRFNRCTTLTARTHSH